MTRAARAAGDLPSAARSLGTVCALWQAGALCGIPGPWAETERVRLTELWLTAIEETTEVMLARGEHAEAATGLAKLVRDYPLREKFAGQLMLAQYRCGRQADALAVFAERAASWSPSWASSPALTCSASTRRCSRLTAR